MLRTYLDTNATIYFVERIDPYYQGIKKRVLDASGAPLITCIISELLLMEVRVLPLRNADQTLLSRYDRYFETFASQNIAFDKSVFELATQLRVRHRVKTP